jgi:NCS2 family nucleobase:cation symporter-2
LRRTGKRKPPGILYAADEPAPAGVAALSALQHVGLNSIFLLFPVLVSREAGSSPEVAASMVSVCMIVLSAGALLQALHRGPVGSGFLIPPVATAAYLVPSLAAARQGGLALVFGMTLFAGVLEMALSRALRALRPLFPPEIVGVVVMLIALAVGALGIRSLLGVGTAEAPGAAHYAVAAVTLGTMVALNVWTRGALRLFGVLIGMAIGYALAVLTDGFGPANRATLAAAAWLAAPRFQHLGWAFDASLIVPFAVGAIAASLKTAGCVMTSQKLNDADWIRADFRSIGRGVFADGVTTALAGGLGTSGVNSASSSVGLANATGVLSRNVAFWIAGILLVLAFFPPIGILLYLIPAPVAGSALLFSATFIFINGLEITASRLLDARRTFVIGLSLMAAVAVDLYPAFFAKLPTGVLGVFGSSLVLGTVTALLLNLVFRLGVRKTERFVVDPANVDPVVIEGFMETQGAAWGARRDVIDRASFNVQQSVETLASSSVASGPLEVAASFDEFNLDVRVSYDGPPLELPEQRPSNEEIMASAEGERRLAGYLLRRYADRVSATQSNGRSTILFHFDH